MRTDRENQASRQPLSFYLLVGVIFWERLAAGLLFSLFALYLREHRGLSATQVFLIVGVYIGGSYLLSIPAGVVADGRLGHLRAAVLGVTLLWCGQAGLFSDRAPLVVPALTLMLIGSGLFRVTIPTLISRLYQPNDQRRETAFGIVYSAINMGYLIGPLSGEWMRARHGWPTIFLIAVSALTMALIILFSGHRRILRETTHRELTQLPRDHIAQRVSAVYLLCGVAVVFWLALQQSTTALTFFAVENTTLRPGYFAAFHGGAVLLLSAFLFALVKRLGSRAPSQPLRLLWGLVFTCGAYALLSATCSGDKRSSALWLFAMYLILSTGEVLYSAMGLSLVTRLAPPQIAGRLNGLWYTAIAGGNLAAGALGLLWTRLSHPRYFAIIAALLLVAGVVLMTRTDQIESLVREKN